MGFLMRVAFFGLVVFIIWYHLKSSIPLLSFRAGMGPADTAAITATQQKLQGLYPPHCGTSVELNTVDYTPDATDNANGMYKISYTWDDYHGFAYLHYIRATDSFEGVDVVPQ